MTRCVVFGSRLVALLVTGAADLCADEWRVTNDDKKKRDWKIVVKDGQADVSRVIKFGRTEPFILSGGAHTYSSMLPDGRQRMQHAAKELTGDEDISNMRTPVVDLPNGETLYQEMPDHPARDEDKATLEQLEQSTWSGTYSNGTRGRITLNGDDGDAGSGVDLLNVQYVAGETFYIFGDWTHGNRKGQFVLKIAPSDVNKLTGMYRERTRRGFTGWEQGGKADRE